jgi:predicted porin
MQKKLLAVAVAGALGAPAVAMAQTSTVQIYGTLYAEYGYAHQGPGGTTAPLNERQNVDILQNPGSELGFKGEEKLGGGLSAWFQCASTMDFRAGTTGGDGVLCSRNSALGMKGGFGNVFIGRWDTPFKRTISPTAVGSNDTGLFGSAFLLTGGSTSTLDNGSRATFKRRQGNAVFYDTPDFGGFQGMAAFSTGNGAGTAGSGTAATTGVTARKPRVLSLGAQYSAGPLYVSAGYERHNQFGGLGVAPVGGVGTGSQSDSAWQLGSAYTWGPVRFGGQYTRQKFDTSGLGAPAAVGTSARYAAWTLGVDWTIVGPHGLRASYTKANDAKGSATNLAAAGAPSTNTLLAGTYRPAPCFGPTVATASCNNTGAYLAQIRYVYTFSKRTEFNLGYVLLHNDSAAAYTLGGLVAPQVGTKQHAYAFSMRHTF